MVLVLSTTEVVGCHQECHQEYALLGRASARAVSHASVWVTVWVGVTTQLCLTPQTLSRATVKNAFRTLKQLATILYTGMDSLM